MPLRQVPAKLLNSIMDNSQGFVLVSYGKIQRTVLFAELRESEFEVDWKSDTDIVNHAATLVFNEIQEAAEVLKTELDKANRQLSVARYVKAIEESFQPLAGTGVETAWGSMFSAFAGYESRLRVLDINLFAEAHGRTVTKVKLDLNALVEVDSDEHLVSIVGDKAFITDLVSEALTEYFL